MERSTIFISYSHEDRDWLVRLLRHMAVLERRRAVHVWSDERIGVGAEWEEEIEVALSSAKIAVLVVTPAFLASHYICEYEMPHIMAHWRNGMSVLPLIVRPCAWQLEEDLRRLQARPIDGQALSLGSEGEIDLNLTEFVYEVASGIRDASPEQASSESNEVGTSATPVEAQKQIIATRVSELPEVRRAHAVAVEAVPRREFVSARIVEERVRNWSGRLQTMPKIFIGHAYKDNAEAIAIAHWLSVNGWTNYYLETVPVDETNTEEDWCRIADEIAKCKAFLLLLSDASMRSRRCHSEAEFARRLGVTIFTIAIQRLSGDFNMSYESLVIREPLGQGRVSDLAVGLPRKDFAIHYDPLNVSFSLDGLNEFFLQLKMLREQMLHESGGSNPYNYVS